MPLSGRYVAVSGNFQAGTWVTDFTDPANPVTVAWSDPASLGPGPSCDPDRDGPLPGRCQQGGAWASYWYNGFIYESDTTNGLNVFRFSDQEAAGALRLPHMNPQTQDMVTRPSRGNDGDPGPVPHVLSLVVGTAVVSGFFYAGWRLFRRGTGRRRRLDSLQPRSTGHDPVPAAGRRSIASSGGRVDRHRRQPQPVFTLSMPFVPKAWLPFVLSGEDKVTRR